MLSLFQGFILLSVITLGVTVVWWTKLRHYGTQRGPQRHTPELKLGRDTSPACPDPGAPHANPRVGTLSDFVERNVGLVTALSLFAAVTIFALQSDRDIVRIYGSLSFFAVALVLAAALFLRAVRSTLRATSSSSSLAMTALCATLLTSLMSLLAYWYGAIRSILYITPYTQNYWLAVILVVGVIILLILMAPAPRFRHSRTLRWVPLGGIAILILGGWGLTVFGAQPSGEWISPQEGAEASEEIRFSARAYRLNDWDAPVKYVNFMAQIKGEWNVACAKVQPKPGTTDTYECNWRIREDVPRDSPLTVSFDVHDARGIARNQADGHRRVWILEPRTERR